ncbi:MAG: carbonic anhydrase [Verrucomicrobiota bacterium]|jgi:carbonic anhydrase
MNHSATYKDVLAGYETFRREVLPKKENLFRQLAGSQSPHVTLLTCSDSRIDPCLITQTNPGDLFVIRNAGNMAPIAEAGTSGELATLQFAVCGLKTRHIVVCGHSDCGAMKGLLAPESCAHLTYLSAWLCEAQEALMMIEENLPQEEKLRAVTNANVRLQLTNLRKLDFVRQAEEEGQLELHGWVYDIGSGNLQIVNSEQIV